MPRPNPERALQREAVLAHRIAYERNVRGWTYEGLAKRMTDVGCPIQPSAIYKIEKSDPPRRISVDELVALSLVLEQSVEELLTPLGDLVQDRIGLAVQNLNVAFMKLAEANEVVGQKIAAIIELREAVDDPNGRALIKSILADLRKDRQPDSVGHTPAMVALGKHLPVMVRAYGG